MSRPAFLAFSALLFLCTEVLHADPETISVPLYVQQVPEDDGTSDTKLAVGLYVGLGGGPPELYQLDTGNGAFYAGYSSTLDPGVSQWWGTTSNTGTTQYADDFGGYKYTFNTTQTVVSLYANGAASTPLATTNQALTVGQMTSSDNPNVNWQATLQAGDPPLHSTYYGNFGARLSSDAADNGSGVYSILGQFINTAGETLTGFSIHLSLVPGQSALTLYFNQNGAPAGFSNASDLALSGDSFPVTGFATTSTDPIIVDSYTVNGTTVTGTGDHFTGLFDTGGTAYTIDDSSDFDSDVTDGVVNPDLPFSMGMPDLSGTGTSTIGFTTGTTPGVDEVVTGGKDPNFGPAVFFDYDVYYDMVNSTISFAPVPEPATWALLGSGLAGLFVIRRRKAKTSDR